VDVRKTQTNGSANQTTETEGDQSLNEQAFQSHKTARLQLEPTRTEYKGKTEKDLVANITGVG
jgi:hypothetical protein